MKRLLPLTLLLVLGTALTSCGTANTTLKYKAEWKNTEASRTPILIESIERVIFRRLAAVEIKNPTITVTPENAQSAIVTITIDDAEGLPTVERILADPFSFDLRLEKGSTPAGDLSTIEWQATGIDGSMLSWVQAFGNPQTSEVSIDLQFNELGKATLGSLAKAQQGKRLGIFVRDLLVSMLTIQSGFSAEQVIISGVPSAVVAEIFADDVNVGLHVSFTPL